MSCEWRRTSETQWEMTQSNPPSELPHDPINSSSSNPDERSSSPTTRGEQAESPRSSPARQIGGDSFSYAAQAETVPIPRDDHFPDPEDLLIPNSPSNPTLASDFDDHISALRTNETGAMKPPRRDAKNVSREKYAEAAASDVEGSEFDVAEDDKEDSDSSYVAEAPKRRGKNVPGKNTRGKPNDKPQTIPKGDAKNKPAPAKKSKQATTTKAQPQKKEATAKTASKPTKQIVGVAGVHKPIVNATAPANMLNGVSGRARDDNKAANRKRPGQIIPDSQTLSTNFSTGKQVKPPASRHPKKPHYDESKGSPSAQGAPSNKTERSHVSSKPGADKKESPSNQSHMRPASPIEINDDEYGGMDDDDLLDLQEPPKAREPNSPPKVQTQTQVSPVAPNSVVGPNSKRKRSPVQSVLKQRSSKNKVCTYGQKATPSLGSSEYFHEAGSQVAKHSQQPGATGRAQAKNQEANPSDKSANSASEEVDNVSTHVKDEIQTTKKEQTRQAISQGPLSKATIYGRGSQSRANTAPGYPKSNVLVVSKEQSPAITSAEDAAQNGTTSMVAQFLAAQENPSRSRDPREAYPPNVQEGPGSIDVYIDQPHEDPILTQEHRSFSKKPSDYQRPNQIPMQSSRRIVNELGSPVQRPMMSSGNAAVFRRSPLRELQQPADHDKWPEVSMETRTPFDSHLVRRPQTSLEAGYQQLPMSILPSARRARPPVRNAPSLDAMTNSENFQTAANSMSRIVLSPSSTVKQSAEKTRNPTPRAPPLLPQSIDFANRVAQRQKQMDYDQEDEDRPLNQRGNHLAMKQLPRHQLNAGTKSLANSQSHPVDAENPVAPLGEPLPKRGMRRSSPTSKSTHESRWQDAVDAASGGVLDTLHVISMSLVEHLRTREENVFTIVNEYKRNGTKISDRLAKRQTEELLNASAVAEQKCLGLAALYGDLSKKTQDFRAKCLSKHRNQAYAEWQREIARVKGSVRAAREKAALS